MVPILRRDRKRAQKIVDAIADGDSTTMAAQTGEIARRTLYEWIYKGQEIRDARMADPMAQITPYDDDYIWFLKSFEQASYKRKKKLVKRIDKAGEDKWQANAWLLERLHPDEFSLKSRVSIESPKDDEVFTLNISRKETPQIAEAEYEIVESE